MQVGYQYDEENKIDDVYFRWRSFKRLIIDPAAEVTLEANPGSADAGRFAGYRSAGVNRSPAARRRRTSSRLSTSTAPAAMSPSRQSSGTS
jgi:hypothetical protein